MHILPQEIEVWYVIPAIRRELAKCLIKEQKISYEKVGNILGITKAAVSHYISNKRAQKIKLHDKALKQICNSCKLLIREKTNAVKEITRILNFIREKNLPSEICGKIKDGNLDDCKEILIYKQV